MYRVAITWLHLALVILVEERLHALLGKLEVAAAEEGEEVSPLLLCRLRVLERIHCSRPLVREII